MMRKRHPAEDAITIVIGAAPKKEGEPLPDEAMEDPLAEDETEEDAEIARMLRQFGV